MASVSGNSDVVTAEGDCLSREELITAYGRLSAADKLKLDQIEAIRRGGTGFEPGELLHRALCSGVLGERHCPRSLPLIVFLAQAMRSMASHERERLSKLVSLHEVPREGQSDACPVLKQVDALAVVEMERKTRSAEVIDEILAIFKDDEKCQLILMGWIEGYRGEALRELTGLDQGGLDYAIRRIRSKMKKLYPNGWAP